MGMVALSQYRNYSTHNFIQLLINHWCKINNWKYQWFYTVQSDFKLYSHIAKWKWSHHFPYSYSCSIEYIPWNSCWTVESALLWNWTAVILFVEFCFINGLNCTQVCRYILSLFLVVSVVAISKYCHNKKMNAVLSKLMVDKKNQPRTQ